MLLYAAIMRPDSLYQANYGQSLLSLNASCSRRPAVEGAGAEVTLVVEISLPALV